ncbi:S8 family serine peptidase [Kitasatospora sp. NPDC048538]|uniref:S8 family serine peptidase n=1 Tax=unclassified Kitasatospora TaxID=2633591 RepID=UPI0033EA66BA
MGTIRTETVSGGARRSRIDEPSSASRTGGASPLDLVTLGALMARSRGRPETVVALLDGPVALGHPGLRGGSLRRLPGGTPVGCAEPGSEQCRHGTFVAGLLAARRGTAAPGICPDCTLLVRPVFAEPGQPGAAAPRTDPDQLAEALAAVVDAGARVVNISADLSWSAVRDGRALTGALDHAARRGVIVVAAAGNQGVVGSSVLTRHPAVIPVAACDRHGRPAPYSNLGATIGRSGLSAPGEGLLGLATGERQPPIRGTSVAAPLVTGAVALLWSEFPRAGAADVRRALCDAARSRRTLWPALLDASRALDRLAARTGVTTTARRPS